MLPAVVGDALAGICIVRLFRLRPGVRLMFMSIRAVVGIKVVSGSSTTLEATPVWLLMVMDETPAPGMLLRL
jgi:hypothetical protein